MSENTGLLCATCLREGAPSPAVTIVAGTAVCAAHVPPPAPGGDPETDTSTPVVVDLSDLDEGVQHHMK